MDWKYLAHGRGAVAIASDRIAAGETVCFDLYKRHPERESHLLFTERRFFSLFLDAAEGDRMPGLRVSSTTDMREDGSHAVIASWNPHATHPVHIAAALTYHLCHATDYWFIVQEEPSKAVEPQL
jgi:hypothetical protein